MRYSEIRRFNQTTRHLEVDGSFNETYSFGHEWWDVPFEDVKYISLITWHTRVNGENKVEPRWLNGYPGEYRSGVWVFTKDLPENPNWFDILYTIDELIYESGSYRRYLEVIEKVGNSLRVEFGS